MCITPLSRPLSLPYREASDGFIPYSETSWPTEALGLTNRGRRATKSSLHVAHSHANTQAKMQIQLKITRTQGKPQVIRNYKSYTSMACILY